MSVLLFVWVYATAALIVSAYVYFRGIVFRPVPKEFEVEDTAVLTLAALLVGAAWVLFTPALLVLWMLQVTRWIEARIPRLAVRHAGEVRARS